MFLNRLKDLKADVIINLCEASPAVPSSKSNVAAAFELMRRRLHRQRSADPGPLPEQVQDQGRPQVVRPADGAGPARGLRPTRRSTSPSRSSSSPTARTPAWASTRIRSPRRRGAPEAGPAHHRGLQAARPGRGVHRGPGVQRRRLRERQARGPARLRDRFRPDARRPAPHLQLRGEVVRGRTPSTAVAPDLPGADRRRPPGQAPGDARSRPSWPADAATTPGWISGWTRRGGSSSSRSTPIPTSASTPATPGRSAPRASNTSSSGSALIEKALARRAEDILAP